MQHVGPEKDTTPRIILTRIFLLHEFLYATKGGIVYLFRYALRVACLKMFGFAWILILRVSKRPVETLSAEVEVKQKNE